MKESLKKTAYGLLNKFVECGSKQPKTKILMYHGICPEHFQSHLCYLTSTLEVVSLEAGLQELGKSQVVITIDDGYRKDAEAAYPLLKRFGLRATLFITYEFADQNSFAWWDRMTACRKHASHFRLKCLPADELERRVEKITGLTKRDKKPSKYDFLAWEELVRMADVFDYGSHSETHPILTSISPEDAWKEIEGSKHKIEKKIGLPVRAFAYPNGNYSTSIREMVKAAGYRCAVTTRRGSNRAQSDAFSLRRWGIGAAENMDVFTFKITSPI